MDSDELSDDFVQIKTKNVSNSKTQTDPDDSDDSLVSSSESKSDKNSSNTSSLNCKFCKIAFTFKSNCTRHERHCPANSERGPVRFPCPQCSAHFNRKHHLNTHLKKCSKESPKTKKKNPTPCLIKAHPDEAKIKPKKSFTFKSFEEFLTWKEKEEETTFSFFTAKKGQAHKNTKHYYCQHDGAGSTQRKTSRVNFKGRVKVGHFCMAKMKATVGSQTEIHVQYYPTHSHVCKKEDMLHHALPAAMSKFIDEKLAESIPLTVVYELVKEHFLPENSLEVLDTRASILTKKRILERGRRRRMARRLHKDDAKAVFLLANQLMEKDDSILIFKHFEMPLVHGPDGINRINSRDLFMFGFQTDRQLDLMKRHCSKIIIVDETHGTNQYKYQLLTVMVLDENRRGWPVAHLITSKSDSYTLKFFFEALNSRLDPEHQVSVHSVITDVDPALIKSMEAGFSKKLRHLLCKWHVFKYLKDNLRTKIPHELFETILSEIKVIMNAESETSFLKLKQGFLNKYNNDPRASKYMSYLDQHYWPRAEKWAMCYRNFPHGEVNTTGHIESFHHRLKRVYIKRKIDKRLDDLIHILYDIEWDDHCSRLREASIVFAVQPQHILERHQRGLLMEDSMIIEQSLDKLWGVKSVTGSSSTTYIVERYKDFCNFEFCFSKCSKPECHGLCAHLFSCSCPDHHPLCKHIHKLQSYLTRGEPFFPIGDEEFYIFNSSKTTEDFIIESDQSCQNENVFSHDRKRSIILEKLLQSNASRLQQFITTAQENNEIPDNALIHADSVLSDLLQGLESSVKHHKPNDMSTVPTMQPVVTFAPNEKLKTQLSQLPCFKRPQKRKLKDNPSVLAAKKQAAIDNLLTCALIDANDSPDSDNDSDPSPVHPSFTLPTSYVTDPFDWVFHYGQGDNISLIHLKSLRHLKLKGTQFSRAFRKARSSAAHSKTNAVQLRVPKDTQFTAPEIGTACRLEENLLDGEEEMFQKRDPIFKRGWLYCTIVNTFFAKLSQKHERVFALSSDHASRALRRISNVGFLSNFLLVLKSKEIMLRPVNFGGHWCILVVHIKEEEIMFYDPLQAPLNNNCITLLTQMIADLKIIFSSSSMWKIKVVQRPKQTDTLSCGPLICEYAVQSLDISSAFQSTYEVRKYIYSVIVGRCLQRPTYNLEDCGKCHVKYSDDRDPLRAWVRCSSCHQWFHDSCVDHKSDDIRAEPFVCP
ncbi:Sentrin-specific protease 1 [Frankliniella fusca]|uniref:Sentrin-specific protease 1 n=1 Tax=Frankliniella fusca TaxID=407009 RepID=A0AAE1HBT9_9NEOP|nr:Sentrin-specific protease 1 [Frankliniella fusca]